jgi:Tol biopolymer transport system component
VSAAGGAPTPLTTGAGEDTEPDISADGRTLLYGTQRKSWSLVLLDAATGRETEVLSRRTPLVFSVFSPIGDRIAFVQPARAGVQLHVASADGRDVRQVTRGEGEQNIFPQWSGDGASLYFYRALPSKSFRKIPVEGGTSTEVAAWDFRKEASAKVDPQGREIVYVLGEGPAKATLIRDLETGKDRTLSLALDRPSWSPDSQTIFGDYTSPDPTGDIWNRWNVAACPADGAPCRTLTRGFRAISSGDGTRLFYARDTGAARNMREIWTISVKGGDARRVATVGPLPPDWDYDVSRTDQILFIRLNASRRELWVAQLRK